MKGKTLIIFAIIAIFIALIAVATVKEKQEKTQENGNIFTVPLGEEIPKSGGYCLLGILTETKFDMVIKAYVSPCWANESVYYPDPRYLQTFPLSDGMARGSTVNRDIPLVTEKGTVVILKGGDTKKIIFKVNEPINGIASLN
jgi:hypothetical protein